MHTPQPLNQTREQITNLDNELLALLAERRRLSLEVARSKEVDVRPIRDTQREKELLARLVKEGREKGLDAHYVISLYQSIIEDSVLNQQAYLHGRANPETQNSNIVSPTSVHEAPTLISQQPAIANAAKLKCWT